ncbi:hypothetical protein LY90DRAFT_676575 [Neocallimastix californiae]|uniref:Uncharacterized protein n=1 Tax=Neocallimastix californiae TaxID=1754190 RepID=A0A1Y2AFT0_9FUNG|nr:hypothetical protein LY90DRAFT_676575 [Neocallimastix californiae]|eukprot:ORY20815.1 hypothetical protein LY90DRAFT_676575 [Neocallimastix californiae]
MFSKRRLLIVIVLLSLIEYVYGQTYKGPALGVGWGTLLLTVSFLMIAAIWLLTAYSNNFNNIVIYTSIFYISLFLFLISIPTKPIEYDTNSKSSSNDIVKY